MATGVERGSHLDREGIRTDRAKWNLSVAALYEEAVKNQEGRSPLTDRSSAGRGSTRGGRRTTSSSCASLDETNIGWGKLNKAMEQAHWTRCQDFMVAAGQGMCARLLCGRGPGMPAGCGSYQRIRLAQSVLPQPVHRRSGRGGAAARSSPSSINPASRRIPRHGTNTEVVIALNSRRSSCSSAAPATPAR
jgi:hypothetical protein